MLILFFLPMAQSPARAEAKFEAIKMKDLATSLTVQLQWSWHAIGIDPSDNVYVVFGGPDGESADCALFQYKARTGEKRLIGTLSAAAKEAGTWREGERIEKGHTHLPWLNGKLYIGTMGFHDASNNSPGQMKIAENSHGAHLMAYNPETDKIEDCGRNEPDGVFFPKRGFMCLTPVPEENLIVGFTVPGGDLLLYDTIKEETRAKVTGPADEFGRYVTREVVSAPNGKLYYMYASLDGKTPGHMYSYDLKTGEQSGPFKIDPYYWNGSVKTKEGRIFITTDPGYFYELHPETNIVERVGSACPESDQGEAEDPDGEHLYQRPHVLGIVLSADDKSIYSIPLRKRILKSESGPRVKGEKLPAGPQVPFGLFKYDIATRTSERVAEVPPEIGNGYISGTNIRDSQGNMYFARHGGSFMGLVKVHPGE